MTTKKGVGSPLDKRVADQLEVRSEVFSKQSRGKSTLLFLNANKPWIKLSSGVNTLSDAEITALEASGRLTPQTGAAELAKKNTLGPLKTKGGVSNQTFNPVTISEKGAVADTGVLRNTTYNKYTGLGFRPEPGIVSATVQSKGSFGALRESTVSFIVWTLEDLNLVEALYLRPGFSMLLEWGHSLYFNNAEQFSTLPLQFGDDFFTSLTRKEIEGRIEELRVKSGYNYDAVYGYVKNFSWDFRKDGGYDCTITIASAGTVVESLRVDRSPMDFIPAEFFTRASLEVSREEQKSIFHYFINRLRIVNRFTITKDSLQELTNRVEGVLIAPSFLEKLQPFTIYRKKILDKFWPWQPDTHIYYIPLYLVLDIINNFLAKTKDGNQLLEFYTGQDTAQNATYGKECKFVTSPYHFALDPTVCLLAKTPTVPVEVSQALTGTPVPTIRQLAGESFKHYKGADDDILNIYITDVLLQPIVDSFIEVDKSSTRTILAFVEEILAKINDNLGGVNELGIHEDERYCYVVDRKNTPNTVENYPILNLTGLKTTVTDLKISSKLSNQVGSQIAIAAQGIENNYNENISELLTWNRGVVDRHINSQIKVLAEFDQIQADINQLYLPDQATINARIVKDKREVWAKGLKEIYKKYYSESYDEIDYKEHLTYFREYMSDLVLSYQPALNEPEKGIIPIELSFTLLGVSGITIATAFRIAKGVLPDKYSNRFGFIVTGLEHEISSQWTTKVRTQFYILEQPSSALREALKPRQRLELEQAPVPGFEGETPNADRVRQVLPTLGYTEKGRELSNGGDITASMASATLAVLSTIKSRLPNINIRLVAGNDRYHQVNSNLSRHIKGNGVDFTVNPATPANLNAVEEILLAFTAGNSFFRFLNEYKITTALTTGGHFHISWGLGTEGQSNITKAQSLVASGKLTPITI
jgi:hypothetical protein